MEQNMTGPPPAMHFTAPHQPADGDLEAITRKRTRVARKKFRVVASTVLACNRFTNRKKISCVLEVDADDSEEPEQTLAALFSSARSEQSSSEELMTGYGYKGHCTTYPPEADEEMIPPPHAANSGFLSNPDQGYYHGKSEPFQQAVAAMFTLPNSDTGFLYAPNEGEETGQFEQGIEQVQKLLDEPDAPYEGLKSPAPSSSVWRSLENLLKADEKRQHWLKLASDLNADVTKKIQDLQSGSDRAKVHKLVEDAEEIIKKIENGGSTSDGKKSQKMRVDAKTLPTIREVEQSLSDVFEKLQGHVNDMTNNFLGRQKQHTSLAAMSRLIEYGRKAVRKQSSWTDSVEGKLSSLKKDLNYRGLTVDKHFQKCAEQIPRLVQSFLQNQQGNFVSVASVTDWYLQEDNGLHNAEDSPAPCPSFDAFRCFDGETFS